MFGIGRNGIFDVNFFLRHEREGIERVFNSIIFQKSHVMLVD